MDEQTQRTPAGVVRLSVRRALWRGIGGRPAPPAWATRSVPEDGAVTHERLSLVHPRVLAWDGLTPTDLSLSVVDRPSGCSWERLPPTIQVEGGSYPLAEARRLVHALQCLLEASAVE